jgi:hypothetical protein
MKTSEQQTINVDHCQSCGRSCADGQNTDDGYTQCCNELVIWGGGCHPEDCHHA